MVPSVPAPETCVGNQGRERSKIDGERSWCSWEGRRRWIAAHLARLMAMTERERRAMGSEGRTEVESRYAWNRISRDLLAVYGRFLGSVPRPDCVQEFR